jgi:hypothetical protein
MLRRAILIVVAAGFVSGQSLQLPPERKQAILAYQLTPAKADHLVVALTAMTKYVMSLPDYQDRVKKSMTMTLPEQIAMFEKDPKTAAILKENKLTARDYLIGVPTLRMAIMAAEGNQNVVASPFNVAFAKAHLKELKPKLEEADRAAGRK